MMSRSKLNRLLLYLAILLCLLWAVAISPVAIAWLYTSDNHIASANARKMLWAASGLTILAGIAISLLGRSRWSIVATYAALLLVLATPGLAWFYWHSNPNRHHWDRPLTAAEALAQITVPEGFTVELIAAEPDLVNPVALAFDNRGRAWISESIEYPRLAPGPGKDCIKILEDTNGDGKADKIKVFADDLNMPTGLAIGYGGVWVANAPDLLFLQDTDGDDKADKREVVLTGFGRNDPHELPSSLTWGPDGWLYGLNGISNPSVIQHQGQTYSFSCAMFRLHPVTRKFEVFCEGTSNPWGLAWDVEGNAFVSACVIDHLWNFAEGVYYRNQSGHYPPNCWPAPSIVKHQHQSAAYAGLEYYDSDAYPPNYRHRLYMGNLHGGCVNVDRLWRAGATYFAEPEPDLLTAHDGWFMPIAIETGPDGCLHILDWYDRYHCHQDAERDPAGIDRLRGRLYRVRYATTPRTLPRNLARDSDTQLIERLKSGNAYLRRTALRLLQERLNQQQNEKLGQLLQEMVFAPALPRRSRLLALWALIGGGQLPSDFLLNLLNSDDPAFRAWGVRAAGDAKSHTPELLARIALLAAVSEPAVQAEVLVAARKIERLDGLAICLDALEFSPADTLLCHQAWQTLSPLLISEQARFQARVEQIELNRSPNLAEILPRAMQLILDGSGGEADSANLLLSFLEKPKLSPVDEQVALQSVQRLTERVQSGGLPPATLVELQTKLQPALDKLLAGDIDSRLRLPAIWLAASWGDAAAIAAAREMWSNPQTAPTDRAAALDALVTAGAPDILKLVETQWAQFATDHGELRSRTLAALNRTDAPAVGSFLLAHFQQLNPAEQTQALEILTGRAIWAGQLLDAIEAEHFPATLVNTEQVRKLQSLPDKTIVARAKALWGTVRQERNPDRAEVVARMKTIVKSTPGNSLRGVKVFARSCSQCHRLHDVGYTIGPDLATNGRASLDQLLSNVFDPNLVIGSAYQTRTIATDDGRVVTGLLAEENDKHIVLKLPGGKLETIPRDTIDELVENRVSLMPEGLERQLTPQEVADLIAYLMQLQR
jgi:putative heme-binding domain-containing protein